MCLTLPKYLIPHPSTCQIKSQRCTTRWWSDTSYKLIQVTFSISATAGKSKSSCRAEQSVSALTTASSWANLKIKRLRMYLCGSVWIRRTFLWAFLCQNLLLQLINYMAGLRYTHESLAMQLQYLTVFPLHTWSKCLKRGSFHEHYAWNRGVMYRSHFIVGCELVWTSQWTRDHMQSSGVNQNILRKTCKYIVKLLNVVYKIQ